MATFAAMVICGRLSNLVQPENPFRISSSMIERLRHQKKGLISWLINIIPYGTVALTFDLTIDVEVDADLLIDVDEQDYI